VTIEHTRDFRRVKRLCGQSLPINIGRDHYYLMSSGDKAVWYFHPYPVFPMLMVHFRSAPDFHARTAVRESCGAFRWIWDNTNAQVIRAAIGRGHKAEKLARLAGMRFQYLDVDNYAWYSLDRPQEMRLAG